MRVIPEQSVVRGDRQKLGLTRLTNGGPRRESMSAAGVAGMGRYAQESRRRDRTARYATLSRTRGRRHERMVDLHHRNAPCRHSFPVHDRSGHDERHGALRRVRTDVHRASVSSVAGTASSSAGSRNRLRRRNGSPQPGRWNNRLTGRRLVDPVPNPPRLARPRMHLWRLRCVAPFPESVNRGRHYRSHGA